MNSRLVVLATVVAFGLALPAAAQKTVQFQTPVKLEKIDPSVTGFFVYCSIPTGPGTQAYANSNNVSLQNGAYTGMVTTSVTVAQADLGKVTGSWSCTLRLSGPGAPGGAGINLPQFSWTKAAPGSVGTVNGSF